MKIVIVGKTQMTAGNVCVGGLSDDGRLSFRLRTDTGSYWPSDTDLEVGDIWDMELAPVKSLIPPHIEDVLVLKRKKLGRHSALNKFIRGSAFVWPGALGNIFEGKLAVTGPGKGYIQKNALSSRSTGFWVSESELKLELYEKKACYLAPIAPGFAAVHTPRRIPFKGVETPLPILPKGTLIRFSLAKWWKPRDADEKCPEMCFLQLSGWY